MPDAIRPMSSLPPQQMPMTDDPSEKQLTTKNPAELRSKFDDAVSSTFYRQMFKALRASTGNGSPLTNSQTEKIFQQQLDEVLIERMSKATGGGFSQDLFEQQFRHLEAAKAKTETSKPGDKFQADI